MEKRLVTDLFKEWWEMNGPCPNVFAILEVVNPAVRERFQEYHEYVEDLWYNDPWTS